VSWDPFQRAVLAELGHVLYVPADGAGQAGAGAVDAAMLARLARAAGVEADALLAHADIAAASANLRGDAAGKRALWPRLRAMRRDAQ
jgi:hypothetical protein